MDFDLTGGAFDAMFAHAEQQAPRECCGLLVKVAESEALLYVAAENVWPAEEPDRFSIHPETYARVADDLGEVVAIVHSHPNASANPSMADRVGCEKSGLPWLIVGWPSGVVKRVDPEGWRAPYKGREFAHGVLDCYTLIQDWFRRELEVVLPDFDRSDGWWEERPDHARENLYVENFARAGFVLAHGEPKRHDVFLMQVKADVANHGAIYLGDGNILHHLHGMLSCENPYGGFWQRHTVAMLRHRDLIFDEVALKAAA